MYNSRVGRRTKRISDSAKFSPKLRDRRITDEDDDNDVEIGETALTPEEIQGLLELLPYKEALIKIAKGEFEIERVEEVDEDEDADADKDADADAEAEDNFEEDEDFTEGEEGSEDSDEEDYEDFEEEDEETTAVDSANTEAWKKRLSGNNK